MTRLDFLLMSMVLIWGANFSLVKVALRDFPELAFNAFRLVIASGVFLGAIWWQRRRAVAPGSESQSDLAAPLSGAEWRRLVTLGVIGHLVYQFCFLGGVKRTSVGNGSLILGTTPVIVALLTSWAGHERVPPLRWLGVAVSFLGLYIIVGHGVEWTAEGSAGDLLMLTSTLCWATYSVASVPLLRVRSPLVVTGYSMTIGGGLYVLVTVPTLWGVNWSAISAQSWVLMILSALFALAFAYLIWYTSVQRAGSTRTAAWSNLTPIAAMAIGALWLGEPVAAYQISGAIAIFTGLVITRRS
jgi:drug/metabolite transporter (DMT)-like permease